MNDSVYIFIYIQEAAMVIGMGFATNSTILPALVDKVYFFYENSYIILFTTV
jgi:7-keto-8-aminopelargonate synthetase-like enzyme